jgi:hypothetical protein
MSSDGSYKSTAMIHRGRFTEEFSVDRLQTVFGKGNVHSNVSIYESKGRKAAEIDVLVLFGNRAVVLQAKSKRLTIEAKRGNDRQIRADFQKSVQDSYDQGFKCANLLADPKYRLIDVNSREIGRPRTFKEIYILCVVSDSYPALNFQAQQLLKLERTETIQPPLITDVFTLDVMSEMLESPLHFLSYLSRRTGYYDRLIAADELSILSLHLKRNLWIEDEHDVLVVNDNISADLDVAMAVRRDNVPGKRTPDGILTRVADTILGRMVAQIGVEADPRTIDLGLILLRLSEDAVLRISSGIDAIASKARQDRKAHDITVPLAESGTGLTIHCNDDAVSMASRRLHRHCKTRKYIQKAKSWFGVCLSPSNTSIRFGLSLDYEWTPDVKMDAISSHLLAARNCVSQIRSAGHKRKIWRNQPCPCGSGLKYKRCCLKR